MVDGMDFPEKLQVKEFNLDLILEELGSVGRYQVLILLLISLPIFFHVTTSLSFVFTAGDLNYRCFIPECEEQDTTFEADWLSSALTADRCQRYQPKYSTFNLSICNQFFNTTQKCDAWIFQGSEVTITNEFHLLCDDNQWKLTLVGSMNSLGYFVTTPIAGYASDRYGRKAVLLVSTALSCAVGIARSFSPNYNVFLFLEFFDMAVGGSAYETAFVLGMEQVGPHSRLLGGVLMCAMDVVGQVLLGLMAWWIQDWRILLRALYLPALLMLSYYWIMPESIRWLMVSGRKKEAAKLIQKAAKINKIVLSENTQKMLDLSTVNDEKSKEVCLEEKQEYMEGAFGEILRSSILLGRLLICCFCWGTNMFIFYGLSLYSVSMAGNKYLNFILVSVIELPGYVVAYYGMDKLGRKPTLSMAYLLSGICCVSYIVIPDDLLWLRITLYLIGKFGITISYSVIHVYATELFPTRLRHLMMGMCSMVGGAGEMVAPQTPLLGRYMEALPLALFGTLSIFSGLLALLFPETMGTKLPDTIKEAEVIGKQKATVEQETYKPTIDA